jgi:Calcineurin-like phosphoesterase
LEGKNVSFMLLTTRVQIFGNHDDANRFGTNQTKTSREELLRTDQQFPLSLSRATKGLFGTSNYLVEIHYPSQWSQQQQQHRKDTVALQLFFLDSGGGVLPQMLATNQIQWFQQQHRNDVKGVIVFQHIPAFQFAYNGRVCRGLHDDPVDFIHPDPGIVQVLQEAGNVQLLASGHDHGNDYCCATNFSSNSPTKSSNLHLCFGRHSGYGGYGKWDRGARVYKLELVNRPSESSFSGMGDSLLRWKSWVRNESGGILDRYDPSLNVGL